MRRGWGGRNVLHCVLSSCVQCHDIVCRSRRESLSSKPSTIVTEKSKGGKGWGKIISLKGWKGGTLFFLASQKRTTSSTTWSHNRTSVVRNTRLKIDGDNIIWHHDVMWAAPLRGRFRCIVVMLSTLIERCYTTTSLIRLAVHKSLQFWSYPFWKRCSWIKVIVNRRSPCVFIME